MANEFEKIRAKYRELFPDLRMTVEYGSPTAPDEIIDLLRKGAGVDAVTYIDESRLVVKVVNPNKIPSNISFNPKYMPQCICASVTEGYVKIWPITPLNDTKKFATFQYKKEVTDDMGERGPLVTKFEDYLKGLGYTRVVSQSAASKATK